MKIVNECRRELAVVHAHQYCLCYRPVTLGSLIDQVSLSLHSEILRFANRIECVDL